MPPRLSLCRPLPTRPRLSSSSRSSINFCVRSQRGFADGKDPKPASGPNQDVLGHVSEEAADLGNVTGETSPDIGRGTPVQERDEEGKEKAPKVIQEEMEHEKKNSSEATSFANLLALGQTGAIASGGRTHVGDAVGHKFDLPALPLPAKSNIKHRYEPIVSQVTNLLMRDGKLSVAQRNMSHILNHLRTAPPPTPNPSRPLLPSAPPASHLPLNPVLYLTLAIDSVAPLLRIRLLKGAAGGGVALQIPVPLGLRQRRRQAMQWILDAANKKKSRGSGRGQFAQRVAEEIVSVAEGKSAAWDRRGLLHKSGTSARINLNYSQTRRR
ncbi:MAG: hypothetical protein M1818_008456 [Claussenomyces sp. TS43310]|nr:MAG: hypothetical protein M1818_008456 [Claussenomyces sp. TS43310]